MKKVLCLALVLVFLLAVSISVSAESSGSDGEAIDWDAVDWETYDWKTLNMGEESASLSTWLKTEASFAKLFAVTRNCSHAAYGETLYGINYGRFMEKPEAFLIALGKEDGETQDRVLDSVIFEFAYVWEFEDKVTTVNTLESISLSRAETPEAVALMEDLIGRLSEELNISIEIPKTGDPVLITVALALFSGSGLGVLLKKKKE